MIGYVVKHLCNILSFLSKKKFTGKKKDFFSQIPVLNLKLHLLNFTVFLSEWLFPSWYKINLQKKKNSIKKTTWNVIYICIDVISSRAWKNYGLIVLDQNITEFVSIMWRASAHLLELFNLDESNHEHSLKLPSKIIHFSWNLKRAVKDHNYYISSLVTYQVIYINIRDM